MKSLTTFNKIKNININIIIIFLKSLIRNNFNNDINKNKFKNIDRDKRESTNILIFKSYNNN